MPGTPGLDAGRGPGPFVRNDGCATDAPLPLNRVRIYPKSGAGAMLIGAKIQGSNEGSTGGFVDLATISAVLPDEQYSELTFTNTTLYRYLRFFDPSGRKVPIAEVEFLHSDTRLKGEPYGTVDTTNGSRPFSNALDGDVTTSFLGSTSGGNYLGYDVGGPYTAAAPAFTPAAGALSAATDVAISTETPGAKIRYTLDSSTPSATAGTLYERAVRVESQITIRAVAYGDCLFPSKVSAATFSIGDSAVRGRKSYQIGNSLTDDAFEQLETTIDSTGVDHSAARVVIPGSPLGEIWQYRNVPPPWDTRPNKETAFQDPPGAADIDNFVRTFAPIDDVVVQPFADPLFETQGGAAVGIFGEVLKYSPQAQPWVYAQWARWHAIDPMNPEQGFLKDGFARGAPHAGWPAPEKPVPETWADTTIAQMRYYEAFRDYVDQRVGGKKVLIVPVGPALVELKRQIDSRLIPGLTDFVPTIIDMDGLHLTNAGEYLDVLVHYACFYKQSPVGRVTARPSELNEAQAIALQRIAWEVVSTYPLAGIVGP